METIAVVGRLLPRESVRAIGAMAVSAGLDVNDEVFTGTLIIVYTVIAAATFAVAWHFAPPLIFGQAATSVVLACGAVLLSALITYQVLALIIDRRKAAVEALLPDYLQLAVANVRAGMPIDRALWHAARPEFGLLSREVELASRKAFGGEPLDVALSDLAAKFKSRYLNRTVELIRSAITSGGEIAAILEKTALDVRNAQIMQREITATMTTYAMLITFAAVIGAPLLFAVSSRLITLFERLPTAQIQIPTPIPLRPGAAPIGITSKDFANFAVLLIIATCVIASMIVAVINTGRKREALKYILPFLIVAFLVLVGAEQLFERLGY